MRTRTRTNVSTWVTGAAGIRIQSNVYCAGNPPSDTSNINVAAYMVPVKYTEECMTDSLGKSQIHAVQHRSKTVSLGDADYVIYANSIGGRSCVSSYGPSAQVANWQVGFMNYFLPWSVSSGSSIPGSWSFGNLGFNEDVLKNDVLEQARNLKADLLLDLIEANQIWPSVKSLTTSLPIMAKNWHSIRKVIRTASGSFLAWKFGISPLLHDFMSVHRYLPKIKKDIDTVRKAKPRRYSRMAELSASCVSLAYVNGLMGNSMIKWDSNVVIPPRIRYVLVVKPNTKYLTDAFASIDNFLSRFATSPASLAWEKIPFSFVVDWFVDLRGALQKIDSLMGVTPYQVISFTRSFNYHLANSWQGVYKSPCNGSVIQTVPVGSCECKLYERSLASTSTNLVMWKPRFGKSQAAISAALISQSLSKI